MGLDDPGLPRKRNVPSKLEMDSSENHYPPIPKDLYHQQYFQSLADCQLYYTRFNQPVYNTLELLVIKSARKKTII